MFVNTYSPITVCNDATKTQSTQSMNSYANMWQDTCSSVCFPCTIWQQFGKSCVKVNLRNCAYGFISCDMRRCLGNFASSKWCHFITLPPIASCIWLHKDSPNLGLAGVLHCSRTWQNTEPTLVVTKQLGDNSFVSLINMSEGVLRIGMGAMWHIYIIYITSTRCPCCVFVRKGHTHPHCQRMSSLHSLFRVHFYYFSLYRFVRFACNRATTQEPWLHFTTFLWLCIVLTAWVSCIEIHMCTARNVGGLAAIISSIWTVFVCSNTSIPDTIEAILIEIGA